MIYLQLFYEFFKTGLFAIGGGLATLPFLRRLSVLSGGCESFLRSALALAVFHERGLISLNREGDRIQLCLIPTQGKVDLFACPYLSRLRPAAGESRGDR